MGRHDACRLFRQKFAGLIFFALPEQSIPSRIFHHGRCLCPRSRNRPVLAFGAWRVRKRLPKRVPHRFHLAIIGKPHNRILRFRVRLGFLGPLSPNILVPYSDSYGMLCPTIVLFLYTSASNQRVKCLLIPLFSYLGYCIKPTAIFALGAIVLLEGFSYLGQVIQAGKKAFSQAFLRRVLTGALCALLSFAAAFGIAGIVKTASGITPNRENSVSAAHYLMMGFNADYTGVFSSEDLSFSESQPTYDERVAANLSAWQNRVVELGPEGVSKLLAKKAMLSYGEGAFTWRDWYFENVYGDNAAIRWIYGIPDESQTPLKLKPTDVVPWAWPAQVMWFMCLVGIVLSALKRNASRKECALCLALLMLSAFLLLFECRARYLFLFAPYFVILGTIGWHRFGRSAVRKRSRTVQVSNRRQHIPSDWTRAPRSRDYGSPRHESKQA